MEDLQGLFAQIDGLFHPRSVAVVGVPRGLKTGKLFLMALVDQGFPGKIFPVNPEAGEIDGLKAYPSVSAIPGPVDLAIVLVSNRSAIPVVQECAEKGVKGLVLFSAGFKETGTDDGKAMEQELVLLARSSGMRLMGPNCMGLYCPKTGLSFFPQLSKESGPVGFISHSGSLANILARMAPDKGLRFSKAVSLGNECDLTCVDFLHYLGEDPHTGLVGAYIEGVKDGPRFLKVLKRVTSRKPVILWKVGLTLEGSLAAASHTGALACSERTWEAVVRQGGAVAVVGLEALVDALMGFSMLPAGMGDRIAILSGPGGMAVAAAEACARWGLKLAELSDRSREELAKFIPPTGASVSNPIDVGLSSFLEMDLYVNSARILAEDPGVDAVFVVGAGMTHESNQFFTESIIRTRYQYGKPFVMVNIPGFDPAFARMFCQAGVPFFDSAERAAAVYAMVRSDHQARAQRTVPGRD